MSDGGSTIKHSYTIPCASAFRDAVEKLAARRKVNVGDVARSVLLVMPADTIAAFPDPGEPAADDRETVILKSGPALGRPWRRKPRLQVRMAPGYEVTFIRRALGMALAMDQGSVKLRLDDPAAEPPPPPVDTEQLKREVEAELEARLRQEADARLRAEAEAAHKRALATVNEEVERLKAIINVLSFEPLAEGVRSREEALHVLGFPPGARPDKRMLRAKFRMLATVHHPDSNHGSHHRMSQLNAAMEMLKDVW